MKKKFSISGVPDFDTNSYKKKLYNSNYKETF